MAKARVRAMVLPQCSAPYEGMKGMYYGGSSCREISEKIGKSKDAVRKKVQRMIKKGELKAGENRPAN